MIKLKTKEEIKILRRGGKILNKIINELIEKIRPGISSKELDWMAENLIKKAGGKPSFKNYRPDFAQSPYEATICFSPNNVIVHGVPNSSLIEEGDIVSIDIGMEYDGLFTDMAKTVGVGKITPQATKLIEATKKAMAMAIKAAKPGAHLGDVGFAIESVAKKNGFGVVRQLTGHGVGYSPHESPNVNNFGNKGKGVELKPGLVIAIEPMLSVGSGDIMELSDGSCATDDGCLSAHFEHTVAITDKGNIVITNP